MKPFCSFQNVPATHPLIHSDLSYPFHCRVSMLQIHDRTGQFITKPFLLLFIRVAMTQKRCSQGARPTARDPAQKKKQNPKAPKHRIFQIWGLAISPQAWLSFYSHPNKANPEEKERGGRHQVPESLPLQSQESRSQVRSKSKNEKKGLRCCR